MLELKTILSYIIFFIILFTVLSFKNIKSFIKEIKFYFFEFINILKQNFYFSIIFFFIILEIFLIIRYLYLYGIDGWDTFMYHIPISSRIILEKGMPSFNFLNSFIPHFFFPKNAEFLFSYFYIFNKSIDFAPLFHIIFIFFGVLSIYSILRKLNVKREKALFSFLLFFLPIFPHQSVTGYCDIELNMLFVIFINFLINEDKFSKILALISLSISTGVKITPLPCLFIFFLYLIYKFWKKKYLIIISFIISTLTSLHFYIFNFINTKNPLYPFHFKIKNLTIFSGTCKTKEFIEPPGWTFNPILISKRLIEFDSFNEFSYVHDNRSAGFGHLFISTMFYIPILILIFIQFKEKNNKMIKMLIFILIFYFTQTYKWWPRFVIFLPFFSFLSYIYLWEKFKQENLEAFLITIGILTFTEGMNSLIFFEPFNFKESLFIPKFVKNSICNILPYIDENDKIGIFKETEKESENFRTIRKLSGYILKYKFLTRIEYIDEKGINKYDKIISDQNMNVENYEILYKDENLIFWKRK